MLAKNLVSTDLYKLLHQAMSLINNWVRIKDIGETITLYVNTIRIRMANVTNDVDVMSEDFNVVDVDVDVRSHFGSSHCLDQANEV